MAQALPSLPLVGALLGLALVILDLALSVFFPLGIRAVGLLAFNAIITGMLHLDGFVDCCDALLGTRSVERRWTSCAIAVSAPMATLAARCC